MPNDKENNLLVNKESSVPGEGVQVSARAYGREWALPDLLERLRGDGALERLLRMALRSFALEEEARRAGFSISDEELQAASDQFRQKQGLLDADTTMAWLEAQAMSFDDFEIFLERRLLSEKLRQHLLKSDESISKALAGDRAQVSLILVADEDVALEIKAQIEDEEATFASMAERYSQHPSAAAKGQLGRVERGSLDDTLADQVFAARPGALVGPVKMEQGYCLAQVGAIERNQLSPHEKQALLDRALEQFLNKRLQENGAALRLSLPESKGS